MRIKDLDIEYERVSDSLHKYHFNGGHHGRLFTITDDLYNPNLKMDRRTTAKVLGNYSETSIENMVYDRLLDNKNFLEVYHNSVFTREHIKEAKKVLADTLIMDILENNFRGIVTIKQTCEGKRIYIEGYLGAYKISIISNGNRVVIYKNYKFQNDIVKVKVNEVVYKGINIGLNYLVEYSNRILETVRIKRLKGTIELNKKECTDINYINLKDTTIKVMDRSNIIVHYKSHNSKRVCKYIKPTGELMIDEQCSADEITVFKGILLEYKDLEIPTGVDVFKFLKMRYREKVLELIKSDFNLEVVSKYGDRVHTYTRGKYSVIFSTIGYSEPLIFEYSEDDLRKRVYAIDINQQTIDSRTLKGLSVELTSEKRGVYLSGKHSKFDKINEDTLRIKKKIKTSR